MMRSGNRDMRRMLDRMGLDMKDLSSVEGSHYKNRYQRDISKKTSGCRNEGKG